MEQKLHDAASKLPETSLDFSAIQPAPRAKPGRAWRAVASLAACVILLISVGFVTVEAKEYSDAIKFFNEYGLSTDGLSRGEIKEIYRDITTKSFTYAKTAEVIAGSISSDKIGGYEILQENLTPEDVLNLWNYKNYSGGFVVSGDDGSTWLGVSSNRQGVHYEYRAEYKEDPKLGFEVHDRSIVEKYEDGELLWSVPISLFWVNGITTVSDGVIAYGETPTWSSAQHSYAWMAKIDSEGSLLWTCMLNNGFKDEYIAEILENEDGTYAVISRGDYKFFCLSQYSSGGKEISFQKTEVGNYGIWNAARFGDGYIVQLGSHMTNEYSRIVKVDRQGNITESFSYGSEDAYYYITDMIEYNGNIYLSAYSVPRLEDEAQSAGGRYEIAAVLNYLFDNDIWKISSEELTPMVRDNYTAMLLVCDPNVGTPQEFYSVKGSLGGKLSLGDSGMLLWDVESITSTFFSPQTSAFTIAGSSFVFRYTFDSAGKLVSQEKTGEITSFYR